MKRALRDLDVRYVFALRQLGHPATSIAKEFGVSRTMIDNILSRKAYKDVSMEEELMENWPAVRGQVGHGVGENHWNWLGGVRDHPLYGTWKDIKQRTTNPNCPKWLSYGGRGITMFSGWLESKGSRNFLDWVDENLGPRPEGWTLDRIDNDGNYEPGNLRWAPAVIQYNNTRPALSANIVRRVIELSEQAKTENRLINPDEILSVIKALDQ